MIIRKGEVPAEEVLGELGVAVTGASPKASGSLGFAKGALGTIPVGLLTLLTSDLLELGAKTELARLFTRLQKMRLDPTPLAGTTVSAWAEQSIRHESVRAIVLAL